MLKTCFISLMALLMGSSTYAQQIPDSSRSAISISDTTGDDIPISDYDDLFNDLDSFLDSLLAPRNSFIAGLSVLNSFYNYQGAGPNSVAGFKSTVYSPYLGFYSSGGLGIQGNARFIKENKLNLYQFSLTPSFDYIKNRNFASGFSFTRYFTKDSLDFYTTPLQNEISAYFIYRRSWIRPSIIASYGWGSKTELEKRERLLRRLRYRIPGYVFTNNEESIMDFSIVLSARHDFYWLRVFHEKDFIRLTPQLSLTNGSQKYGFNQTSGFGTTIPRTGNNVLFYTTEVRMEEDFSFQPLSLSMYIRAEYAIGKFYFQPQVIFDYYFPASRHQFNTLFSLNNGFMF